MKTCFVIQPFDKDKYDKRYRDTYSPAIEKAGLSPYRVDNDPSTRILIEDIEENIKNADIIFADITLDNPNVWYELGYALAKQKDTIMVCCTDERKTDFPFDVRHRSIITYQSGSVSDFTKLEGQIYEKITAYLSTAKAVEKLIIAPIGENEELKSREIALLFLLVESQNEPSHFISGYVLTSNALKVGYKKLDVNLGLRTLCSENFLVTAQMDDGYHDSSYLGYNLSEKGEKWVMAHQHFMNLGRSA